MKAKYIANRLKLENEAQALLDEGKFAEAIVKSTEIENLDKDYDLGVKAQANLKALKDNNIVDNNIAVLSAGILDAAPALTDEEKAEAENKAYVNAWAKDMQKKSLTDEEKAVFNKVNEAYKNTAHGTDTQGIVIPNTVAKGIWTEVYKMSPVLAELASTYITGTFTIIKDEEVENDEAEWVDEKTQGKDGELSLGSIDLSGCELVKHISVSWKLRKMSIQEFIPYIQNLLAKKMKRALAIGIVKGLGKKQTGDSHKDQSLGIVTSIKSEADKPQHLEYTGQLSYKDITLLLSKNKKGATGAKFFANSTMIWTQLANIVDANGRPIFIADATLGGVGRMFGKVVMEEETMADDMLLLGNIKEGYKVNVNQDIVLMSEEKMLDRLTVYMAYAIVDGTPIDNEYFAVAEKATARTKKS